MSRDIRSFFSPKSTKTVTPLPKHKKNAAILSSSDDEIPASSEKQKRKLPSKRRLDSSEDENGNSPKKVNPTKKTNLGKLKQSSETKSQEPRKKPVDVTSVFGSATVARVNKKKLKTSTAVEDSKIHSDDEFERSIAESVSVLEKIENENKNINLSVKTEPASNNEDSISHTRELEKRKSPSTNISASVKEERRSTTPETKDINLTLTKYIQPENDMDAVDFNLTPSNNKKRRTSSYNNKHNTSTAEEDEDRQQKKRLTAILYQKFKNRTSVINHGCKPLPKGKPNCLSRYTFVITGILESLEREECAKLIEEYGGKVTTGLSKKTNFMVVGEEAGPKKLAQADEFKVKQLTEDDLFQMINNTLKKTENQSGEQSNITKISLEEPKIKRDVEKPKLAITPKKQVSNDIPLVTIVKKVVKKEITEEKNTIDNKTIISPKSTGDLNSLPWVEKYKPMTSKDIIGQQGASSNLTKLKSWLEKWYDNHDGKKKLQKPSPWAKNDDGSYYKAALLSGPPGVGKTTTVNLVCKELGLDMVEFNASDTRSKKLLQEEVSELLSNQSLFGYFNDAKVGLTKKHVLIMDEVDGMAGNEDRGGIQELIGLIKNTSVPIICMCNDRNHQKMRSLVNYCYDLRFQKPRLEQIKSAMMSVLYKEKFKIPPATLTDIITASNNDIRQTINFLSLLSAKKNLDEIGVKTDTSKKDMKLGPWDVVRKVFSAEDHKAMSIHDKSDLFFHDYSLAPLFVQQNYLSVSPHGPKSELLDRVAETADSLSMGDLVDRRIRTNNAWSLLPTQAMFSSVLPGEYMEGHFTGQINFPGWLGKYSRNTKRKRLAQEVHDHTRVCTSASVTSFRLDYAPSLLNAIVRPLKDRGLDGVSESLDVLKEYRLLREDIESIIELTSWPGRKNPFETVDSKVKAALTRTYNKEVGPYSYSVTAASKKKKADKLDEMEMLDGEGEINIDSEEEKDDDNLDSDVLIKAKKAPAKRTKTVATTSKTTAKISKKKK